MQKNKIRVRFEGMCRNMLPHKYLQLVTKLQLIQSNIFKVFIKDTQLCKP